VCEKAILWTACCFQKKKPFFIKWWKAQCISTSQHEHSIFREGTDRKNLSTKLQQGNSVLDQHIRENERKGEKMMLEIK
jgi:hypothetical protein